MSSQASLRYLPMQAAHVPQLSGLLPTLLSGVWSAEALQAMQAANHQLRIVESVQGVMGFAEFLMVADECQIFAIAVVQTCQRQGIGTMLLRSVLEEAVEQGMREAVLEVRASNQAARSLYQRAGFVQTGTRPRYYPPLHGQSDEEAAILYSCALSS